MATNHGEKHVLIVEDSVDIMGLLKNILESKGYQINCSVNGAEALNYLNSVAQLPDVILLDMRMPIMNGYDFINIQRRSAKLKKIPVVIMGADNLSEMAGVDLKSENILQKPLNMNSVLEAVERNSKLH